MASGESGDPGWQLLLRPRPHGPTPGCTPGPPRGPSAPGPPGDRRGGDQEGTGAGGSVITPTCSGSCTPDRAGAVQHLAKHWPGQGARHPAYGALVGGLLRDGLGAAEVEGIVRSLAEVTGDEEGGKRIAWVAETVKALEGG